MKFTSDIDIDLGDRDSIIARINVTPAMVSSQGSHRKHNTGVYPTAVPVNPLTGICSINYIDAEERGYVKLDLLNVWVYKHVKSETHLAELMVEPDWTLLGDRQFFENLIHIGKHWGSAAAMPEPINSIPRLAMFLAVIRPGKRHLIGKPWSEVAASVWEKSSDGYMFKKSHSLAYAHLVVVNINLLATGVKLDALQE